MSTLNIKKLFCLIVASVLIYGCTEEVDPGKLGIKDQLLVVNSLISPEQDTLSVEVSLSRPIFGELLDYGSNEDLVTDATVTLSDGTTTVALTYNATFERYLVRATALPIVEGSTYTLRVTSGEFTTVATTRVPFGVTPTEVRLGQAQNFEQRVTLTWQDPADQVNFYRARVTQQDASGRIYDTGYFDEQEYHSDVNTNGGVISARGEIYFSGGQGQFNLLVGNLISCDENYFRYFRNRNNFDSEDPFSEPTLTHTNIDGGTGIFASYSTRELSIELD